MGLAGRVYGADDDRCGDVPRITLHDTFARQYAEDLDTAMSEIVCKATWQNSARGMAAGLAAPIPGLEFIDIQASYGETSGSQNGESACASRFNNLTRKQRENLFITRLSPFARDAIAAWRDCIGRGNPAPVEGKITSYDGREFILNLALTGHLGNPVVKTFSHSPNVTCDTPDFNSDPKKIFAHDEKLKCTRKDDGRITFTLTFEGTGVHPINPVILPAKPKKPCQRLPNCFYVDEESCECAVRVCGENDPCDGGTPLACVASGEIPTEVKPGRILWGPAVPRDEFDQGPEEKRRPRTGEIAYGEWENTACTAKLERHIGGTGWHARIGSCETSGYTGPGYQRCQQVLVK